MKRLICWLRGHVWVQLPYEEAPKGWWIEQHQCSRCNVYKRELVASRMG
jgi:hypothetical protein